MMRVLNSQAIRDELQAKLPLDAINRLKPELRDVAMQSFDRFADLIAELVIYEAGGEEQMAKQVEVDIKNIAETILDLIAVEEFKKASGVFSDTLKDVGELFQGVAKEAIKIAAKKAAEVALDAVTRKLGA